MLPVLEVCQHLLTDLVSQLIGYSQPSHIGFALNQDMWNQNCAFLLENRFESCRLPHTGLPRNQLKESMYIASI